MNDKEKQSKCNNLPKSEGKININLGSTIKGQVPKMKNPPPPPKKD